MSAMRWEKPPLLSGLGVSNAYESVARLTLIGHDKGIANALSRSVLCRLPAFSHC